MSHRDMSDDTLASKQGLDLSAESLTHDHSFNKAPSLSTSSTEILAVRRIITDLLAQSLITDDLMQAERKLKSILNHAELEDATPEWSQLLVDCQACLSCIFMINKKTALAVGMWTASQRLSTLTGCYVSRETQELLQRLANFYKERSKSQSSVLL